VASFDDQACRRCFGLDLGGDITISDRELDRNAFDVRRPPSAQVTVVAAGPGANPANNASLSTRTW